MAQRGAPRNYRKLKNFGLIKFAQNKLKIDFSKSERRKRNPIQIHSMDSLDSLKAENLICQNNKKRHFYVIWIFLCLRSRFDMQNLGILNNSLLWEMFCKSQYAHSSLIRCEASIFRCYLSSFHDNWIIKTRCRVESINKPFHFFSSFLEAMRLISDIKNDHFEPINFIQVRLMRLACSAASNLPISNLF